MSSEQNKSPDPWWWRPPMLALLAVVALIGVGLLVWDVVQIALEARAMR